MIRTIKLKLNCSEEDEKALLDTMEAYTIAFDVAAGWGFENHIKNRFQLQRGVYKKIRELVPKLNSSLVLTAIHCCCDGLKGSKCLKPQKRKKYGAMRYTKKAARIVLDCSFVSLTTVSGRRKISFVHPEYFRLKYNGWTVLSSIISYCRSTRSFFLGIAVEKKISPQDVRGEALGIDRGLRNIAVTSDNEFFNSKFVNSIRGRFAYNRATLQAKGTRSARRRLKKNAGRERRFIACQNHIITKRIADKPYSLFVLEDLTSIGNKIATNKYLRNKLHQWPYYQFEKLLRYKAQERGKRVIRIPPEYTSMTCSNCGHVDKSNRIGCILMCVRCGFQIDADLNAARNIANLGRSWNGRLNANQPHAPRNDAWTLKWDSGNAERRCERPDRSQMALRGEIVKGD